MNKLAVVLGVAAVATLAGCKDPEYARKRSAVQDEVKSVETEPVVEKQAETVKAEKPVEVVEVKVEPVQKCTCAPGTKHEKPCECAASDCKCIVVAAEAKSDAVAPVAPAEPEYTVYIVQRGDYLAKISKKFNIKVDAIKKLNNLTSDNIRLGQKLKLPGKVEVGAQEVPAGAVKATPKKVYESYTGATKEYVVVAGDSLGKIAYSNGMNIRQLKELNGLTKDTVYIGQKLKIADSSAAPKAVAAAAAPVAAAPVVQAKAVAAPKAAAPKTVTSAAVKVEQPKAVESKAAESAAAAPQAEAAVDAVEQPAAAAPADGTTDYVVQDGDDLPTIAIEFRVPVARLRELNNLGEGDEVKPGQTLKIPAEQ